MTAADVWGVSVGHCPDVPLINALTERDAAQQEVAGLFDPPWLDLFRLSPSGLETALYRLGQAHNVVGQIPGEVVAWLGEILARRDAAAWVLAERLAEVGP
jgi:hypothetical protein